MKKYPKFLMAAELIDKWIDEDKIKIEEMQHIMKHLTVLIGKRM